MRKKERKSLLELPYLNLNSRKISGKSEAGYINSEAESVYEFMSGIKS